MMRSMHALGWPLVAFLVWISYQKGTAGRQPSIREFVLLHETKMNSMTDQKVDSGGKPLLELKNEPLQLLEDGDDTNPSAPGGPVADNSRCHVCHLNYMDEEIAVVHAKANLGCVHCHGNCDAHIADESWASGGNGTPPEIMYRRQDIDLSCQKCHKNHDVPAQFVIDRWLERQSGHSGKQNPQKTACTDCHGTHRLKERKCRWK
ncbi:MAG: hypothetical protein JW829_14735 [Pirellulales bacterium]|nr:hypothetical protein [Pirellulales bacterium]